MNDESGVFTADAQQLDQFGFINISLDMVREWIIRSIFIAALGTLLSLRFPFCNEVHFLFWLRHRRPIKGVRNRFRRDNRAM